MKRVRLALVPAVAVIILTSACGGSSGGTATGSGTPAATSGAAASAADPASSGAADPGSSSAAAAPKPVAGGGAQVSDPAEGYQLTLPKGYVQLKNKADVEKLLREGAKKLTSTELQKIASQISANTIKMYAVNSTTGNTINLVVAAAPGAKPDDLNSPSAREALAGQLARIGVKAPAFSEITVAGGPALRSASSYAPTGVTLQMVQIYAVHADKVFTFTFTGTKVPAADEQVVRDSLSFL
jgi:hypothetical protein